MFDCIIVGGGPAGLSAALILGRCRRSVLVCDAGRPRNSRAAAINGWEWRDRRIAVYGRGESGLALTGKVSLWSRDLVVCTDGPHELSPAQLSALSQIDARIITQPIERLEGEGGQLRSIRFSDGTQLDRDALFIITHQVQASSLAARLGCEDLKRRTVPTGEHQKTHVPGLYVVGDASRDVQMVIIAAAEGADAAFSINKYLLAQELPPELLI